MVPAQCRAARGLLKWSQKDLAQASGFTPLTIRKFENEFGTVRQSTVEEIVKVFEDAGVIFIGEGDDGPGVRLRKAVRDRVLKERGLLP